MSGRHFDRKHLVAVGASRRPTKGSLFYAPPMAVRAVELGLPVVHVVPPFHLKGHDLRGRNLLVPLHLVAVGSRLRLIDDHVGLVAPQSVPAKRGKRCASLCNRHVVALHF